MPEADREKWNARYAAGSHTGLEPSAFLTGLDGLLPREGRALDVAGGAGRHALWLARRGLAVTLLDVSDVALSRARASAEEAGLLLETQQIDLAAQALPAGPWDLIVDSYYLERPLFSQFPSALAPGGWLVFCQPTRTNLERNPQPGARFLLEDGELRGLVAGLEVVRYEESWSDEGSYEARLVARKPD